MPSDSVAANDLTTLLSGVLTVEEVTTTQETEADYDVLIQGSDRKYPAIVVRRKHRGKGATIRTISRFGQHKAVYDDYAGVVEAYQARRAKRKSVVSGRSDESQPASTREKRADKAVQTVVEGSDNSQGDSRSIRQHSLD